MPITIEAGERLSRSLLWRLQRAYFSQEGLSAWGSATVPHYITCNAFIAECYARVVAGWLRDCVARGIDRTQPIHLVELGAGSGRFGFLFLKKLGALLERAPFGKLEILYVMTDFADEQVAAFARHEALRELVAEGRLDFARFDVERDQELQLVERKQTLSPGSVKNPMAVLANYYFDSIPQDAFYLCQGQLFECATSLTVPDGFPVDENNPALLTHVELSYEDRQVSSDYYGDAELDAILEAHRAHVEKGSVRIPTAALAACRVFSALSSNRWLLLSGDKGYVLPESLDTRERPGLALHGSFSMDVNYFALAEWFRGRGGQALTMDHRHNSLDVVAFVLGEGDHAETRDAYAGFIETFGPDDYFIVRRAMEQNKTEMSLEEACALLRLSRHDPRLLRALVGTLRKLAPKATHSARKHLAKLVERCMDLYFHIGEEHDLSFAVGVMLIDLGSYERAVELFDASWRLYGPDAGTAYNLALAHQRLGHADDAVSWAKQALTLEPAHAAAQRLRDQLPG